MFIERDISLAGLLIRNRIFCASNRTSDASYSGSDSNFGLEFIQNVFWRWLRNGFEKSGAQAAEFFTEAAVAEGCWAADAASRYSGNNRSAPPKW